MLGITSFMLTVEYSLEKEILNSLSDFACRTSKKLEIMKMCVVSTWYNTPILMI